MSTLTKIAAVLLAAVWTSGARADPAGTTALALVADWKAGDREMAAVAEVIASAFASGMSWAGTIEGHPLYCPPPNGAFTGNQAMNILENYLSDHPETADKTYGLALSASLRQAFPCAPT
jgi:Rap1a immunity proteins